MICINLARPKATGLGTWAWTKALFWVWMEVKLSTWINKELDRLIRDAEGAISI
jgi:hypothetical protein